MFKRIHDEYFPGACDAQNLQDQEADRADAEQGHALQEERLGKIDCVNGDSKRFEHDSLKWIEVARQ